jgi:hypothetical protein
MSPTRAACAEAVEGASHRANFLEAAIVIDGSRDPVASRRFDDLVKEAQLVIEARLPRSRQESPARHIGTLPGAAATRLG